MNKLIFALMATAFAGSVMAADVALKSDAKVGVAVPATATATPEKPAAAPKMARSKHVAKKAAAQKTAVTKSDMATDHAMSATHAIPAKK